MQPHRIFFPALDAQGNGPPVSRTVAQIVSACGWSVVTDLDAETLPTVTHVFICAWETVDARFSTEENRDFLLSLTATATVLTLGHKDHHQWLTRFSPKVTILRTMDDLDNWIGKLLGEAKGATHA